MRDTAGAFRGFSPEKHWFYKRMGNDICVTKQLLEGITLRKISKFYFGKQLSIKIFVKDEGNFGGIVYIIVSDGGRTTENDIKKI